jgi:hypothetical protein
VLMGPVLRECLLIITKGWYLECGGIITEGTTSEQAKMLGVQFYQKNQGVILPLQHNIKCNTQIIYCAQNTRPT